MDKRQHPLIRSRCIWLYKIQICDRNIKTSSFSRGGGVLIAIRKSLRSKPLILENNNIEILFILIKLHNQSVIISSVYIPHSHDRNILFDPYLASLNHYIIKFKMRHLF